MDDLVKVTDEQRYLFDLQGCECSIRLNPFFADADPWLPAPTR